MTTKYDEQIARVRTHLLDHPRDWQSVISLFRLQSSRFLYIEHRKRIEKMICVAALRAQRRRRE